MQEAALEGEGDSERAGSHSGVVGSNLTSSPASAPPLLGTTGPKEGRAGPPSLIRVDRDTELSVSEGPPVVDQQPQCGEWLSNPTSIPHRCDQIGRLEFAVGSLLWSTQNQGALVSG